VPAPDCNHFTVVEELAQPGSALFAAALKLTQA
jgi:hypothetical protein